MKPIAVLMYRTASATFVSIVISFPISGTLLPDGVDE